MAKPIAGRAPIACEIGSASGDTHLVGFPDGLEHWYRWCRSAGPFGLVGNVARGRILRESRCHCCSGSALLFVTGIGYRIEVLLPMGLSSPVTLVGTATSATSASSSASIHDGTFFGGVSTPSMYLAMKRAGCPFFGDGSPFCLNTTVRWGSRKRGRC